MNRNSLILIFAAMILGIFAGLWITPESTLYAVADFFGQLFMNALKLVIVPLVASSIITGVAKLGEEKEVAILGVKAFGWFLSLTALATLIGLATVLLMNPGAGVAAVEGAVAQKAASCSIPEKLGEIALKFFPPNIIHAAAEGQMLGVIVFALLFGLFIPKIPEELGKTLLHFWRGVFEVMMRITRLFMKFLPIGVFALIAKAIALTGVDGIRSSGWFFLTMMIALALYTLGLLSAFLIAFARVNPGAHIKAMAPALITAFTTSSSAATLPVTLECLEDRAKVPNRIAGFMLPVGTSFHMPGTALFECVAVIFIAQAFGIPLGVTEYVMITLLSFLLSIGVAGIPSGCVVSAMIILSMLNLPLEGVALLFVVERFLDMFRTVVNVYSNSVCARLVTGK
jgi:Na+/H+-dicarboxylate symporter